MTEPNANTAWARVLADELARAGLGHAVVAPGSRSTPVVLALVRHPDVTTHVALDERSGAFLALGLGKRTRAPAAVVTTSGTAAANLHPAVVEARQSEAPLLALTADRPREVRGTDANQTVDQVDLFGDAVRAFHDLPAPELTARALRRLRALADRALADARGPPAGPVHVNLPFAKPLEPTPAPGEVPAALAERAPLGYRGRDDGAPLTAIGPDRPRLTSDELDRLADRLREADRGLVVAGPNPEPGRVGPAALALAREAGFPLLADPLSGARFAPGAPEVAVPGYDLFLREDVAPADLAPEVVLRVGRDPTGKALTRHLEAHPGAEQVVIDAGDTHKDHRATAASYRRADPAHALEGLAERLEAPGDKAWRARWHELGTRALEAAEAEHERAPFEGTVLREAARAVPAGGALFVSNSMPVRDLASFAEPRAETVHARGNRGASGIDGVASTAIGLARAHEGPTLAVLGDLAFLHDRNGLQLAGDGVVFLVVNNDGGGIFHMLPIRDHEHFEPYFATPHGLEPGDVAATHDLEHELVDADDVGPALEEALADPRGQVLEVRTDRETNLARHQAVEDRVRERMPGGDNP